MCGRGEREGWSGAWSPTRWGSCCLCTSTVQKASGVWYPPALLLQLLLPSSSGGWRTQAAWSERQLPTIVLGSDHRVRISREKISPALPRQPFPALLRPAARWNRAHLTAMVQFTSAFWAGGKLWGCWCLLALAGPLWTASHLVLCFYCKELSCFKYLPQQGIEISVRW